MRKRAYAPATVLHWSSKLLWQQCRIGEMLHAWKQKQHHGCINNKKMGSCSISRNNVALYYGSNVAKQ